MTILVVGASGATGRLLAGELLDRGHNIKVIVRTPENLPDHIRNHQNITITEATLLDLTDAELIQQVRGCQAIASCLGHNLSFKGMFGQPRRLVTDATKRLCQAIKDIKREQKTKFVLMNTIGNSNPDLSEEISFGQKLVIGLLRLLLPPHVDNEMAADYLRTKIGQQDEIIEWVAVRPDSLTNADKISDYDLHPSPIRSAIFNSGLTSRINVGHFMADLILDNDCWNRWQGQMPVIYNRELS